MLDAEWITYLSFTIALQISYFFASVQPVTGNTLNSELRECLLVPHARVAAPFHTRFSNQVGSMGRRDVLSTHTRGQLLTILFQGPPSLKQVSEGLLGPRLAETRRSLAKIGLSLGISRTDLETSGDYIPWKALKSCVPFQVPEPSTNQTFRLNDDFTMSRHSLS